MSKNYGKKLWKTLNELMGRSGDHTPSFIEADGSFITKPLHIANYFNDFFVRKIENLKNETTSLHNNFSIQLINNKIMNDKDCEFVFQTIQVDKVKTLLSSINGEKPSGLDNLDGKLLGMVSGSIALPICHIFNLSLLKGVCPLSWKAAKVIPLPKNKEDMFSGANSHPISILPVLSKLMERVVFDQVSSYFSINKLNSEFQHAYKKDHSTITALMQMTDQWMSDIDRKRIVGAVLLDFSAAFDLIDHNMLLMKLAAYGFNNCTLNWMRSYSSNRMQTVYFNGSCSAVKAVQCGVPQGSCLGPLLYSIFTNAMPLVLSKVSVAMFADDSTVYVIKQYG